MFETAAEIRKCADELIAVLSDLPDATGDAWTQENFRRLHAFTQLRNPMLTSYYRKRFEKSEFLWDFIATSPKAGIFLVAESEQAVADGPQVIALKHDFEKLLYVFSPLRVLITKARDRSHAGDLAEALASYAHGCCLAFNPGAVFILHFGLWHPAGNVSYVWQSGGEPNRLVTETIHFEVSPSSTDH